MDLNSLPRAIRCAPLAVFARVVVYGTVIPGRFVVEVSQKARSVCLSVCQSVTCKMKSKSGYALTRTRGA